MTRHPQPSEVTRLRIALLGIYHESNTFIETPTTLKDFENSHLLRGDEIIKEYRNAFHEIGGMLEVLEGNNIEAVPILFAEATPGGMVSAATFQSLLDEMIQGLKKALPVDACLVIPHGAGVSEEYPDMDGHWLGKVRKTVGDKIPIAGTLDPHANVSEEMVKATDILIAYSTNPHVDQRETGKKSAELLLRMIKNGINPVQRLIQAKVAISIEQQLTSAEPCAGIYRRIKEQYARSGIISISLLLGFPYADVKEMGSSFLVISDNEIAATLAGNELDAYLEKIKHNCVGEKQNIEDILPALGNMPKPVLLLDMGDNVGGGSAGNSVFLLNAIEQFGKYHSFICIYDPQAAEMASGHQQNEVFDLSVTDSAGISFSGKVKLISITEGKFHEKNPRHGGHAFYDMGKTAIVKTINGNTIMINSLRIPPFSLMQLTSANVDPQNFDIIIAKGVNAPIAAYGPVCPTIIQVNTPGVTQADMTQFNYKHRRKPLFPFE